ncbi:MAG TPA: YbaB/EbfC family nucleoid-associated protein [Candidatus Sulfotelmatobacter sp.]|nr:YbaB/EbfC family nucleoid-associated protein [Candidatus Sulfotelmatobacter sp.]
MERGKVMKQVQEMHNRMAKLQAELGDMRIAGRAGGGAVTVTVDGNQRVLEVDIQPEALEEGSELLADMVMAACNDALDRSRAAGSEHMGQLTAGLKLPPGLL